MSGAAKEKLTITLPGGVRKSVPKGTAALDLARDLGLPEEPVAVKVNGRLMDLRAPLDADASIEFLPFSSPEGRDVYRHSSAHLMAQAIKSLYPSARIAIGPPVEEGFYYDIDLDRPLTPEDLQKIEHRMGELIAADLPILRSERGRQEAVAFFRELGEPYKVEILEGIPGDTVSLYRQGEFIDLCEGPHLPSTGRIGAVKLMSVAGAYWRGDERNKMLQRVYGTSFPTRAELDEHLKRLEEAQRRDHRKLGRELDLFSIPDESGPGLILWHPKGACVRRVIEDFWRAEHAANGYDLVFTPHLARLDLWRQSGHLDFYRENMFQPIEVEGARYQVKPMNCPFHLLIYRSQKRSYRDLPIRLAELGTVYRYERSGVLHGLLRVRGFTQDDAHILCRPDQLRDEIRGVLRFMLGVFATFGFTQYEVYVSTRPERAVGSEERWAEATGALEAALNAERVAYRVDPGEGVFYGPKIDLKIKDVLGRAWQCATVQVDFNLPERFGVTYTGADGKEHQPIMVHRALLGSLERFFGILIEQYAGAFPLWLAPVQAVVAPITDRQREYAGEVTAALIRRGLRVELDDRNEKIGLKIREVQLQKVPYMLIVGEREKAAGSIAVRRRGGEDLGPRPLEEVAEHLEREVRMRSLEPTGW